MQTAYTEARNTFSIPDSHVGIEQEIRRIQEERDPFMALIPEECLQKRIKNVVDQVFEGLTATQQIKPLFNIESLADAALAIVKDKDGKIEDISKRFPVIVEKLNESKIGREMMLRILHSLSAIFTVNKEEQPSFAKQNSRDEVIQASLFLGAQKCNAELENEKPYICSCLCANVVESFNQHFAKATTSPH